MSISDLVASIVKSASAHQVDRSEKMERTIDVMASNARKIMKKGEGAMISSDSNNRGYGEGRKMGD